MKVYIAARSALAERARVDAMFAAAASIGLTVVGDWRADVDAAAAAGCMTLAEQSVAAATDLAAIRQADAVWLLVPADGGRGCWWEGGYASALGKGLVASGPCDVCVFLSHADHRFESDFEALAFFRRIADPRESMPTMPEGRLVGAERNEPTPR